jgi:hypothetical protein
MMNESGLSEFPPFGGTKGGPIDEHTHPGIFGSPPFGGTKGVSFTGCNGSLMQFEILKIFKGRFTGFESSFCRTRFFPGHCARGAESRGRGKGSWESKVLTEKK